ncbi:MAG: hypothetical protein JSU76_02625 [Dehalococcoidia bacterium]|nr:MAG: hypothetical protein JSU76_02625 [Dehalococcoidia bacterium]
MRCTNHPNVETDLRCGKCGKPICPKCLVHTPVGARCPDCARLQKLPTFHITKRYYLRAILVATSMAFACGAAWWATGVVRGAAYFNFLLAAGFGYAIGEVISRSVNRKRGRSLAFIAGATMVISYVISIFPPWGLWFGGFSPFGLLAVALGVYLAVSRVR